MYKYSIILYNINKYKSVFNLDQELVNRTFFNQGRKWFIKFYITEFKLYNLYTLYDLT